jgi:hypothetical protein
VSDPQVTPGGVNPAAAPGVAHAPLVGVDDVVRITTETRTRTRAVRTSDPFDITGHRTRRNAWHNRRPGLGDGAP